MKKEKNNPLLTFIALKEIVYSYLNTQHLPYVVKKYSNPPKKSIVPIMDSNKSEEYQLKPICPL